MGQQAWLWFPVDDVAVPPAVREQSLVTWVFGAAGLARELAPALCGHVAREGRGVGEGDRARLAGAGEDLGRVNLDVVLPEQLQLREILSEEDDTVLAPLAVPQLHFSSSVKSCHLHAPTITTLKCGQNCPILKLTF